MGNSGGSNFRFFILGLLEHKPMSGYDIKRFLKELGWLVGSPSFGVIYPALHALLSDGLATVEVRAHENKPPRKIYTITPSGRRALREWINEPMAANASLKTFTMRLILAGSLSTDDLIAHLEQRRAQIAAHCDALSRTSPPLLGADLGQRLALDYGYAIASAELAWLDDILGQIRRGLAPSDAGQPESIVETCGARSEGPIPDGLPVASAGLIPPGSLK